MRRDSILRRNRMDMRGYRQEFPLTESCVYLDHASQGPLPAQSAESLRRAVGKGENPTLFGVEDVFELPREIRGLIANLIGATPEEIGLTQSTGHGINIAANCLDVKEGDTILLFDKEFPSNVYPWLNLERRGARVEFIPGKSGHFDIDAFRKRIGARTKVLAISFVQFFNGFRIDLDAVTEICRENGIYVFVDGSQGIGALQFDVRTTPVDIMACCGAKWLLSPIGTGFVYVSERILPTMHPADVGWLSLPREESEEVFEHLTQYDFCLPDDARKFEVGSPLHIPLSAFKSSLELILTVGVDNIEKHITGLLDHLLVFLQSRDFPILSSLEPRHRSAILSFSAQDVRRVHTDLKKRGIYTSVREDGIRVSPHFYNTLEDMDRLIEVLDQV